MSTRLVKIKLLTQDMPVKIETDARTLGELKNVSEVKKLGIDWANTKVINRSDKATFELDESVLPAIDCTLFITPTKTKSGADLPYKEVKAKIKEYKDNGGVVDFNYTQATTADLNAFWNKVQSGPTTTKKVSKVVETVKAMKEQGNSGLTKAEVQAMIDAQLGKKEVKAEVVKETPKEDAILVKDIAEVVTKADLNSEANYLKNKFYK
jgi:hypothetical protein